jgi:hypothetical protein
VTDHCPTVLGPGPDGWGEYHLGAVELAAGADVLVHDAQLLAEELATQAAFGHPAAEYAVGLGRRAGARRVVLFHKHVGDEVMMPGGGREPGSQAVSAAPPRAPSV